MTATDELRKLLDERGVEWRKTPHYSSESQDNETIFEGNGIEWYANDHLNGRLGLRAARYEVTPAQAIEATLGRGELERENAELRELLRVAITYCVNGYCGKDDGCPLRLTDYDCQLLTKASELGVEVDG